MTKKAFQSFAKNHPEEGGQVVVHEDEYYADDHKYVRWWPEMFGELEDVLRLQGRGVEQATAAPGEQRNVRKS